MYLLIQVLQDSIGISAIIASLMLQATRSPRTRLGRTPYRERAWRMRMRTSSRRRRTLPSPASLTKGDVYYNSWLPLWTSVVRTAEETEATDGRSQTTCYLL